MPQELSKSLAVRMTAGELQKPMNVQQAERMRYRSRYVPKSEQLIRTAAAMREKYSRTGKGCRARFQRRDSGGRFGSGSTIGSDPVVGAYPDRNRRILPALRAAK